MLWVACTLLQKNYPGVWINPRIIHVTNSRDRVLVNCGAMTLETYIHSQPRTYTVVGFNDFIRSGTGIIKCNPVVATGKYLEIYHATVKIYENATLIGEHKSIVLEHELLGRGRRSRGGDIEEESTSLSEEFPWEHSTRPFPWLAPLDPVVFAETYVRLEPIYRTFDTGIRRYSDNSAQLTVDPNIFLVHAKI